MAKPFPPFFFFSYVFYDLRGERYKKEKKKKDKNTYLFPFLTKVGNETLTELTLSE